MSNYYYFVLCWNQISWRHKHSCSTIFARQLYCLCCVVRVLVSQCIEYIHFKNEEMNLNYEIYLWINCLDLGQSFLIHFPFLDRYVLYKWLETEIRAWDYALCTDVPVLAPLFLMHLSLTREYQNKNLGYTLLLATLAVFVVFQRVLNFKYTLVSTMS